jgi:uncharacterized membrane protein
VNFAHLFMVSLVPFSTAWVANTRLAAVPVFVYAAVFVLVNLVYCAFVWEELAQAEVEEISARIRRDANAIVPDVGNVRDCDVTVTQVSFVGLWVGLLRFACLSSAGSPGVHTVKMRATLKLNKTSGVPNAVAGKSISSSQR